MTEYLTNLMLMILYYLILSTEKSTRDGVKKSFNCIRFDTDKGFIQHAPPPPPPPFAAFTQYRALLNYN